MTREKHGKEGGWERREGKPTKKVGGVIKEMKRKKGKEKEREKEKEEKKGKKKEEEEGIGGKTLIKKS
jgi:hypothetical protein